MKTPYKILLSILGGIGFLFGTFLFANALTCSTSFPGSLDNYSSSSCIASSWANALEQKIGVNNSASSTSIDYKVNKTKQDNITLNGTPNQINIASTSPTWTFSTPQNISPTSSVVFNTVSSTNSIFTNSTSTNLFIVGLNGILKAINGLVSQAISNVDFSPPITLNSGTGISIASSSPSFTINNSGVLSVNGTNNQILSSSATGTPILSLNIAGGTQTCISGHVSSMTATGTLICSADSGGGGGGLSSTTPFSAGYIPLATSSSALTNSNIYQSGNNIGIGTTTPASTLTVNGDSLFLSTSTFNGSVTFNNLITSTTWSGSGGSFSDNLGAPVSSTTISHAITTNFTPHTFIINFNLQGTVNNGAPHYVAGQAFYNGTSINYTSYWESETGTNNTFAPSISGSAPIVGGGGGNALQVLLYIASSTNSGYTITSKVICDNGSCSSGGLANYAITAFQ